jgi:hypothetical protein
MSVQGRECHAALHTSREQARSRSMALSRVSRLIELSIASATLACTPDSTSEAPHLYAAKVRCTARCVCQIRFKTTVGHKIGSTVLVGCSAWGRTTPDPPCHAPQQQRPALTARCARAQRGQGTALAARPRQSPGALATGCWQWHARSRTGQRRSTPPVACAPPAQTARGQHGHRWLLQRCSALRGRAGLGLPAKTQHVPALMHALQHKSRISQQIQIHCPPYTHIASSTT